MKRRMIIMNNKDNVGVVLEKVDEGDVCVTGQNTVEAVEKIEFGHKIALMEIKKDEYVYKYGEQIGYALKDIKKGGWIHTHNMDCRRGRK